MQITVRDRQSVTDIAMQYLGDPEGAIDIARLNNISVTTELQPGMLLTVPDPKNTQITNYYESEDVSPAMKMDYSKRDEGIDYWILEEDFVVL